MDFLLVKKYSLKREKKNIKKQRLSIDSKINNQRIEKRKKIMKKKIYQDILNFV